MERPLAACWLAASNADVAMASLGLLLKALDLKGVQDRKHCDLQNCLA